MITLSSVFHRWRLQESPEMVPTGEMPRSVMLAADRHLVDRAVPGSRVTVTGIMSIMSQQSRHSNASIRTPYLQVHDKRCISARLATTFSLPDEWTHACKVLGIKNGFEQKTSSGQSLSTFSQVPPFHIMLCSSAG